MEDSKKAHQLKVKQYQALHKEQKTWFRQDAQRLAGKYKSATHYTLAALIPYTEANMKLSFRPSQFFSDLDKLDYIKRQNKFSKESLRNAYYRAIKKGLINMDDGIPRLTAKGQRKLVSFQPKILKGNARLLVVFDIPEKDRWKRSRLRAVLREFHFIQIQKSVWETSYDCRKYLEIAIEEYKLHKNVILYEAAKIT